MRFTAVLAVCLLLPAPGPIASLGAAEVDHPARDGCAAGVGPKCRAESDPQARSGLRRNPSSPAQALGLHEAFSSILWKDWLLKEAPASGGCIDRCRETPRCGNRKIISDRTAPDGRRGGPDSPPSQETITIYRDVHGVPHIYADTNEGVQYGHGYVQAEDHLEDMMTNFLKANGRMAEFFGAEYLPLDVKMHQCKVREIAEERYTEIDAGTRSQLEAFAAGVNFYIKENGATIPQWIHQVAPVTGVDLVAYSRRLQLMFDFTLLTSEWEGKQVVPTNSNAWVIGAERTAEGYAMLHADPHLQWDVENRVYEVHLEGGDFHVLGGAQFGVPAVMVGHTDTTAWGMTRNLTDTADIYIEKLDGTNSKYLFDREWHDIINDPVEVKVLNSEPVILPRLYTHGGERVLFHADLDDNTAYSFRLVGMDQIHILTQMFAVNTAGDLGEFKQAVSMLEYNSVNIIYGDVQGNLFYLYSARQPLKSSEYDWTRPVDGTIADTEWGGLMPFEDLPTIENPASRFLINNNVLPWYVTPGHGIDPQLYPEYLFHMSQDGFNPPGVNFRQLRAADLIAPRFDHTVDDMKTYAMDNYLLTAEYFIPLLEASVNDPEARQLVSDPLNLIDPAFQILQNWDCHAEKTGAGATLFWIIYESLPVPLMVGYVPDPGILRLSDKVKLLNLLLGTARAVQQTYGTLEVPWGDVHKLRRGADVFSLNGGTQREGSLRMATVTSFGGGVGYCSHGSLYLMVSVLKQPIEAYSAKPHGQSEDPNSPHFSDLTDLYSRDELKPCWYALSDILANLESTTVLTYE